MDTPVLSIAMIFRDDIRCIEHCLKALQPLRDAVPCQLVMADTGSKDGSRAVAEKYADELINFPWINDFAAARNAVIERCSGQWLLSVDTDEYLDEDISQLLSFLRQTPPPANLCRVNIRNHCSYDMHGAYSDFFTVRLVRMSFHPRFTGAIHESWEGLEHAGPPMNLVKTVFHHDGYVNMSGNLEKLNRNMTLLREKLKQEPKNLITWMQILDSGHREPDFKDLIRKSVALIQEKVDGWNVFGPPIIRQAVMWADDLEMGEFQEWVDLAESWFPNSYFTRIDVAGRVLLRAFNAGRFEDCAEQGEKLLAAYDDYFAGRGDVNCQICSPLRLASPFYFHTIQTMMANVYIETGEYERAASLLGELDYQSLDGTQTQNLVKTLCRLYSESRLNTDRLVSSAWEGVGVPKPNEGRARERRQVFIQYASAAFSPGRLQEEDGKGQRHAWRAFAPLAGECEIGIASAIMGSDDPGEIAALLGMVEKWNELPYPAVSRAIQKGVPFPLPDKPLSLEEIDRLASGMTGDWRTLYAILTREDAFDGGSPQELVWRQELITAAVQTCAWNESTGGMKLARLFAESEGRFLSLYYGPELLKEENLALLPDMHRFGWYCVRAFAALDGGDTVGYVRFLREGVAACGSMKPMVKFLTEHTPKLEAARPSLELESLAEKVRTILSAYPPDDPAVAALKASPAYQRVAYLIEE